MKLLHFEINGNTHIGVLEGKTVIDLTQSAINNNIYIPINMENLILNFENIENLILKIQNSEKVVYELDQINIKAPINSPEKIMCVGLNYSDHKNEVKDFAKEEAFPVIFSKNNNAICYHKSKIKIPKVANQIDYEAELVIVIGKEAKDIEIEKANEYILGYTIGNDISARDLQNKTSQWLLGKTCDNFAPIGPYIVTKDEVNVQNLDIKCFVNNELKQSSNTKNMIYDCAYLVSYLSKHMTLKAGDLIFTGTPSGVILGLEKEKQVWLKSGDVVKVVIENLGTLENTFE